VKSCNRNSVLCARRGPHAANRHTRCVFGQTQRPSQASCRLGARPRECAGEHDGLSLARHVTCTPSPRAAAPELSLSRHTFVDGMHPSDSSRSPQTAVASSTDETETTWSCSSSLVVPAAITSSGALAAGPCTSAAVSAACTTVPADTAAVPPAAATTCASQTAAATSALSPAAAAPGDACTSPPVAAACAVLPAAASASSTPAAAASVTSPSAAAGDCSSVEYVGESGYQSSEQDVQDTRRAHAVRAAGALRARAAAAVAIGRRFTRSMEGTPLVNPPSGVARRRISRKGARRCR